MIQYPEKYKHAEVIKPALSDQGGYVKEIDSYAIGMTALSLGSGHKNLQDVIKPEVGIMIEKKIGDSVEKVKHWRLSTHRTKTPCRKRNGSC